MADDVAGPRESTLFGAAALAEAERLNRRLAWAPRFNIRYRHETMLIQSILRVSQLGGNRRLRRAGLRVEAGLAMAEGLAVPVRVLRPEGSVRGVVLDFHGGGWAIGNARMNDALNAAMILACNVAVVSVDYRLVGRTTLQGSMNDCLWAARWLLDDGLPEFRGLPVVMVGESAGGHLAAATLLRLKSWPGLLDRIVGAILYYGVFDLAGTDSVRRAGRETLVLDGPGLTSGLQRLTPGMTDEERRRSPLSPLYGDLTDLPPAMMVVGELDPLQDDTMMMAARWREAADVTLLEVPQSPHGFIHFKSAIADVALRQVHDWINNRL